MNHPPSTSAIKRLVTFITIALIVAALYFAQDILIPIALATLLSFLLAPLVTRLERWRLGRIPSVLVVTALVFVVLGVTAYVVADQLIELTNKLPYYKENIRHKVESLKGRGGSLSRAAENLTVIGKEFAESQPATAPATQKSQPDVQIKVKPESPAEASVETPPASQPAPMLVEVYQRPPSPFGRLRSMIFPLLGPLGTAGLVIIFVVFMLIQREDLRNRVIRLTGQGRLYMTTQAMDDAAHRIGAYLRMNLIVNVTYGVPIGLGLYFLGVPQAFLWGLLATILRFIPYIGPWIAASMPIALSLAIFDNWTHPLMVVGWYVVVELISNNAIEPWLYGSSTGMSSLAILVAAAFWTWLWGPVGLLMSTPLTVCIVVMGKYIPGLEFLNVMLGDEPALSPQTHLYQRFLAMDQEEALEIAEKQLETSSLIEVFDKLLIPALHLAELDRHRGRLDEAMQAFIEQGMKALVEDLEEAQQRIDRKLGAAAEKASVAADKTAVAGGAPAPEEEAAVKPASAGDPPMVLCLPARDAADEIVGGMLELALRSRGIAARSASMVKLTGEYMQEVETSGAKLVCVSAMPPMAVSHARYLCKRLRGKFSDIPILVGVWDTPPESPRVGERIVAAGANEVATSLAAAVEKVTLMLQAPALAKARQESDSSRRTP